MDDVNSKNPIRAKDFTGTEGTMISAEESIRTDGSHAFRVRLTYLRGRYVGATFTITEAIELQDLIDSAIIHAGEMERRPR